MSGSTAVVSTAFMAPVLSYWFTSNAVMYAYDWLLSISEEVVIVSQNSLTWSIAIYFLSRTSQLVYLLLTMAFTKPLANWVNCKAFFAVLIITLSVAITSTSFLFFLRVRAVYIQSRTITIIFGALWVATASANIGFAALAARDVEHVPYSPYCTSTPVHNSIPVTMSFVHDTMVFLAISYRLAADAVAAADWRSRVLSIVTGKGLFSLSRSLMKGGQLYYLATTVVFFANLAIMSSPLIHYNWPHYDLISLYYGFTNTMACLVFRGVALGQIEQTPTQHGLTSTAINAAFQMDVSLRNHLAVRGVLLGNPELLEEYAQVKAELGKWGFENTGYYGGGKAWDLEAKGILAPEEVEECDAAAEVTRDVAFCL
ncbi:hypothetical protein FIBSPDRAFT_1041127 [Athelia psychrophila]|uniref:Uncharacterized protein n=1 Tax=Athelia psychrophila TaxID=1759441 RepID=A0A166PGR8_9AGAM|nr:hypothetical protein FIBSPDRAFT_1041127 [Fibularhizoctonia sp. CBS 109695]